MVTMVPGMAATCRLIVIPTHTTCHVFRYPWESAYTGHEVTPDICPLCRENQQHITGDIAYAARQYVAMTMDLDWLQQGQPTGAASGNEFIVEMAKFWESRPSFNDTKGKWEINGNVKNILLVTFSQSVMV